MTRGASGKPGGAAGGPSPPTAKLLETVAGLKARGVAVLLVEQKVEAALKVADRIVFLENGSVRHEATPGELTADPEPLHRYVGVGR